MSNTVFNIDDTNYKMFDKDYIKSNIQDQELKKKYVKYYYNKKYYNTKQLDENQHIKKKHCDICNCDVVLMARHKQSKTHTENEEIQIKPKIDL